MVFQKACKIEMLWFHLYLLKIKSYISLLIQLDVHQNHCPVIYVTKQSISLNSIKPTPSNIDEITLKLLTMVQGFALNNLGFSH